MQVRKQQLEVDMEQQIGSKVGKECVKALYCQPVYLTSLMAQEAMQEARLPSLGWEDPMEKEMATHSSTLAWKISWMEEPGRLQSMRSQRVGHD